jgi:hypothetical protein
MATNPYFSQGRRSEQNLYEDIIIESLKIYGQDIYYLPRDIVNEDKLFGDDVPSKFNSAYKIEMYIDNVDGFDGEGDLFSKFGVEIRDAATFVVSRRRWTQTIARYDNEITVMRPAEGDLLYIPFSKKLFQIMHVEHEMPFYQLQNLPTYKLRCELFEYNDEDFDTGIVGVDKIEESFAYEYVLNLSDTDSADDFVRGDMVYQTLADNVTIRGEVSGWNDSDNELRLIHIGADDGKFHLFSTGGRVVNTRLVELFPAGNKLITGTSENNQISITSQSNYFDTLTDFLDFSETNPFGEPS